MTHVGYEDDDSETSDVGVSEELELDDGGGGGGASLFIGLKKGEQKGIGSGAQITVSSVDALDLPQRMLKLSNLIAPVVMLSLLKTSQAVVVLRDASTRLTTMASIVGTQLKGVTEAIAALLRLMNLLPKFIRLDKDVDNRMSGIINAEVLELLTSQTKKHVTRESHAEFLKAPPPTSKLAKLKARLGKAKTSLSRITSDNYKPVYRDLFYFLDAFATIGKTSEEKNTAQQWGVYMLMSYLFYVEGDVGTATKMADYADSVSIDVAKISK